MAWNPNQAEVARILDIDPRTLSKCEGGKLFPDEAFVVGFCEASDCTADWIYLGRITVALPALLAARIAKIEPDLIPSAHRKAGS